MANSATVIATVKQVPNGIQRIQQNKVVIDTVDTDLVVSTPISGCSIYLKSILSSESSATNLKFKQRSPVLTGTVSTVKGSLTLTVNATTDVWTSSAAHGLVDGQPVQLENSGGALPTGSAAATTYYASVTNYSTTTFKLYDTAAHAIADSTGKINVSDTGSGTHSFDGTKIFGAGTVFTTEFGNLAPAAEIVITSGDTLTISSVTSDTLMVAITEAVTTVSGKTVKRQDLFVTPKLGAYQGFGYSTEPYSWILATKIDYSLVLNASVAIGSLLVNTQEGIS